MLRDDTSRVKTRSGQLRKLGRTWVRGLPTTPRNAMEKREGTKPVPIIAEDTIVRPASCVW